MCFLFSIYLFLPFLSLGPFNLEVYGGSPHLRGVEDAHYAAPAQNMSQAGGGFKLTSLDV